MFIQKNFSIRGVMAFTGGHLIWLTAWMLAVACLYRYTSFGQLVTISWLPISVIATAVAFYLGFKNNSAYDRLWEAHLLTNFTFPALGNLQPVVWFGILSISGSLLSLVVTEANRRRLEKVSQDPARSARWRSTRTRVGGISCGPTLTARRSSTSSSRG